MKDRSGFMDNLGYITYMLENKNNHFSVSYIKKYDNSVKDKRI